MNYSIAKIRAALQYHADCDCEKAQEALTTLAELEKAAAEPVAYQYAHPYFGGGKIWREEQRWNGHTSDEARALYTTPPPAKPAPQFVAGEFTDEVAARVLTHFSNFPVRLTNAQNGHDMIAAVRSELGPALGLVEIREPTPGECIAINEHVLRAHGIEGCGAVLNGRVIFDAVAKWLKGEL